MAYVPDLDVLLTAGYRVEDDGVVYDVEPFDLGAVVLPTGRVVGCDPLVAQATPFVDEVAPGRYELRAWVAILSEDGVESQRRIAALQLVVRDEPVAAWSMALLPGQDMATLGEGESFGYGVDAGTGTLADQVSLTRRSSATSSRSRRFSSAISVVGRSSRSPASASACRIQLRNAS